MWTNYEIEGGSVRVTHAPRKRKPVVYYIKSQGRFGHLDEDMIGRLQVFVDNKAAELGLSGVDGEFAAPPAEEETRFSTEWGRCLRPTPSYGATPSARFAAVDGLEPGAPGYWRSHTTARPARSLAGPFGR